MLLPWTNIFSFNSLVRSKMFSTFCLRLRDHLGARHVQDRSASPASASSSRGLSPPKWFDLWPPHSLCLRCRCVQSQHGTFLRNKAWQNTPNEASALEVTRDRMKYGAVTEEEKGNTKPGECADSTRDPLIVWTWNKRHMSSRKSVRARAKGHCGCVQSERWGFCCLSCTSLACQYSEVDARWMWHGPLNRSALSLFLSRVLLHGDLLLIQMLHTGTFKKSFHKCLRWMSRLLNLLNLDKSQPVTIRVGK